MRRYLTIIAMLSITGCDVLQAKSSSESACTPLAKSSQVNLWRTGQPRKGSYSTTYLDNLNSKAAYGRALADCLIVHSRQFEKDADGALLVARATATACENEQQHYIDYYLATDENIDTADIEGSSRKIRAHVEDVALRYVLEARAGNCSLHRSDTDDGATIPDMLSGS